MPVLKIKKNGSWVEVWGAASGGTGGGAEAPKLTTVTLSKNAWTESDDVYSQTVVCNGVTVYSKLDLQPTPDQIVELQNAEISMMLTNKNGVVTAWSIGGKPTTDYVMNVLITEVSII